MHARRLLLEKGADPNLTYGEGWAPLHQAAAEGSVECARLLLDHGASPQPAENPNTSSPLNCAAQFGHLAVVELLVARGAAVNRASDAQNHPLCYAALAGHVEVIRFLVEKAGALVDLATPKGFNALYAAAQASLDGVVRLNFKFRGGRREL